jgi:8-oxo-dGTP pyrophosphatase MutT (NUDIX family)
MRYCTYSRRTSFFSHPVFDWDESIKGCPFCQVQKSKQIAGIFLFQMQITIGSIRKYFHSFRRTIHRNPDLVPSAVLILLFKKEGKLHVVLTKRTEDVKHHKGQISFPGGAVDKTDETVVDTALRETEEEVGLTRNMVEIIGVLSDFCTPSGFCITPIVGFMSTRPVFILNKSEVSEIFDVPLSFFLDPCNERTERRERFGKMMNLYFYRYGKYEIWGATAEILRTFLSALNTKFKHKKTL